MDDEPTQQSSGNSDDARIDQALAARPLRSTKPPSPYEPRAVESTIELPETQDHTRLRAAAAAVVQQNLTISEAAARYGVDPDTLHIWHRSYVNFVGKNSLAASIQPARQKVEIDEQTSRKFDDNWDEMLRQWELERPQPSPFRQRMLNSPFTRWMFRDGKLDPITVSGAIAVLAFSALAIKAGVSHQGESSELDPNKRESEALGPLDPDALISEHQDELLDRVAKALEQFTVLESWQERLPYLRHPEETRPLMASYYETRGDGAITGLVIDPQVSFIKRSDGVFVLMQGRHTPEGFGSVRTAPLVETNFAAL